MAGEKNWVFWTSVARILFLVLSNALQMALLVLTQTVSYTSLITIKMSLLRLILQISKELSAAGEAPGLPLTIKDML